MADLLEEVTSFCARHMMAESQFGVSALNDKNFVPQLREGRDIRFSTAERVRSFMAEYAPEPSDRAA